MFNSTEYLQNCLKAVYNDKYDLSKIIYISDNIPVKLICPKHGEFFDSPTHLISARKGCPKCWNLQSQGEMKVRALLEEYGFIFEQEKHLPNLDYKLPLYFDFYIPDYNTAIEFNGPQHYMSIDFFGGEDAFAQQQIRDNIKREFCKINNITFIEINFCDDIFKKLENLIYLKMEDDSYN